MICFGLEFCIWKNYTAVYLLIFSRIMLHSKSTKAPCSSVSPKYASILIGAVISVTSIHFIAIVTSGVGWFKVSISTSDLLLIYPTIIPGLSWVLALLGNFDKRHNNIIGAVEIPKLQGAYMISAIVSLILHMYCTFKTTPLLDMSAWQPFLSSLVRLILGAKYVEEEVFCFYVLFTFCSMIVAYVNVVAFIGPEHQTISAKLFLLVKMAAGSIVVGPGAVVALLWLWREDRVRNIDR